MLVFLIEECEVVWVLLLLLLVISLVLALLVYARNDAAEAVLDALLVLRCILLIVTYALVADVSSENIIVLATSRYFMARVSRSILLADAILVSYSGGCRGESTLTLSCIVIKSVGHHFGVHVLSLADLGAVF